MSNMFSIFDPHSSLLYLNWTSALFPLIIIPATYWTTPSALCTSAHTCVNYLCKEFSNLNFPNNTPGMFTFNLSLFTYLWVSNSLTLMPFIFCVTAHPIVPIASMLPLWLGQFFYSWAKSTKMCLAHLVPNNTPMALIPLMVIIEMVSNLIRPLTLSIRLVANITAGHLLLTIIGMSVAYKSTFWALLFLMTTMVSVLLMTLELAVSLIQAYVFSMLLTLFIKEVNFV